MSLLMTSFVPRVLRLRFDTLEQRLLLSVSQPVSTDDVQIAPETNEGSEAAPVSYAVPPDDTVDPLIDCPELDEEYCLEEWYPSDDYAGSSGLTDAAWQDDDSYSDQPVGSDTANNYGEQVAPSPIDAVRYSEASWVSAGQGPDGYLYGASYDAFGYSYGTWPSYDTFGYSYGAWSSYYVAENSRLSAQLVYDSYTPEMSSVGYAATDYYYYDSYYYDCYW